jgi:predicted DNA-binding transcriptional regulator AlpA
MKTLLTNPPTLVTAEKLAEAFSLTLQQVWRLQRQGRIPCVRLGRRTLRFNLNEVAAALEAQTRPAVFTTGRMLQ